MGKFACIDKTVESFLKAKAIEFDKRNVARTYLVLDEERFCAGEITICAYFTLAIKPLDFSDSLSKSKIKSIDGFSKNAKSVGTILIGQLGKDVNYQSLLPGFSVLHEVFSIVHDVFESIGCRIVLLECLDINRVVSFYKANSFEVLQKNHKYLQMIRFL